MLKLVRQTGYCIAVSGFLLFSLSPQASNLDLLAGQDKWLYQEFSEQNDELNREQGWLPLFAMRFQHDLSERHALTLALQRSAGFLQYRGATQAGRSLHTHTHETDYELELGWRWQLGRGWYLRSGIHGWRWFRNIRPSESSVALAERYDSHGPYVGAGSEWAIHDLILSVGAEYRYLTGANMRMDLRPQGYGYVDIPMPDGRAFKAVIQLTKPLSRQWHMGFEYQLSWRTFPWSDDVAASNGFRTIYLAEPESEDFRHGYRLLFRRHW